MITIYSKEGCPDCDQTKELLDSRDVSYDELVVGKDISREEVLKKFPNAKVVPIIMVNQHEVDKNSLRLLLERDQLKTLEQM